MEILGGVTGQTQYRNNKIQSRFGKILFKIETDAAFDVCLANYNITLTKVGKNGEDLMFNRQPLVAIMEPCAYSEGFIRITDLGSGRTRIQGTIDIGNEGSVPFDGDNYAVLDIENVLAGDSITVNTIDYPTTDTTYQKYELQTVQGTTKDISLKGVSGLVFPVGPTGIEKIQIDWDTTAGYVPSTVWNRDELISNCTDTNDLVYAGDVTIYGANAYGRMDFKNAVKLQVVTNTTTQFNVYLLKEEQF